MSRSTSELPLQIVEEECRVTVRFPANTVLSEANVEEMSRQLTGLLDRVRQGQLIVDLSDVNTLTSMILAKFISLNGRVRATGGRLTLLNPTPIVHEVFKITRLDTVLDVAKLPA
jgi:anti-anti-sigma factor